MTRGNTIAALIAAATCVSVASADSVFLDYTNVVGGSTVSLSGGTGTGSYNAGHMAHDIYTDITGATQTGSFNSFCIELQNTDTGSISEYQIVDLTDAPDPDLSGSTDSYTQAQADAVIDVIAKAVELGWIDISLQNSGGTNAQITAIQGAIWQALGFGTADGNSSVDTALTAIANEDVDSGIRTVMANRLRAAVADGEQDMLYVVPMPPAAWAGLGLLGVCAGVRQARRRA